MAKKTKKKKEKKGKSLGERLPRPGLPVILIAVLGLASVSFITLGILKSEPEPEMPAQEIKHNMTVKITPEDRQKIKEASAKSQPKPGQPSPDPGAVKVPRVKPPPTETAAGAGTPTAEGSTAAATEQPVAAGGTAPQAAPAKTTAKESGETAPPATAGSPPSETAATEKTVVAKAQPGSGQATAPTSKAATASTEAPPETKTPAADEQKAKPSLPKPVWQTVDQNWDKVKIDESPSGTGGTGGVWKQLEVGETDKGRETGTAPAEPESTPAKAETAPEKAAPQTVVASPAPAKPKPKTTVRKSTKRTWKKRPRKKNGPPQTDPPGDYQRERSSGTGRSLPGRPGGHGLSGRQTREPDATERPDHYSIRIRLQIQGPDPGQTHPRGQSTHSRQPSRLKRNNHSGPLISLLPG